MEPVLVGSHHVERAVGRAVVDDDRLESGVVLGHERFETRCDGGGAVACQDDDRQRRQRSVSGRIIRRAQGWNDERALTASSRRRSATLRSTRGLSVAWERRRHVASNRLRKKASNHNVRPRAANRMDRMRADADGPAVRGGPSRHRTVDQESRADGGEGEAATKACLAAFPVDTQVETRLARPSRS